MQVRSSGAGPADRAMEGAGGVRDQEGMVRWFTRQTKLSLYKQETSQ